MTAPCATAPLSLVLSFHGWGSSARGQARGGLSELSDTLPADATFISVYPQGLGNMNAAAAQQRAAGGWSRGTSVPSWNGGGCAHSPGPLGETCEQFATGNLEVRWPKNSFWDSSSCACPLTTVPCLLAPWDAQNYGALDLHYDNCPADSYCNCCSCADDIGFVEALLAWLEANFCIDMARVYATGSSYGGMMTYQLAMSLPDTFAAFAPAYGGLLKGFADVPASPDAGWVPILDIHGVYGQYHARAVHSPMHVWGTFACRPRVTDALSSQLLTRRVIGM